MVISKNISNFATQIKIEERYGNSDSEAGGAL
jgi:hypothetical protein